MNQWDALTVSVMFASFFAAVAFINRPTRSRRCVGTCTRAADPDGKPLRYCRGCFQDMPEEEAP